MKKYYCYNCYGIWIGTRTLEEIEKWNAQPLPASKKIKYWDEVWQTSFLFVAELVVTNHYSPNFHALKC